MQRELKLTTIFVTHDQEEAFELADRLGVMNAGRLLEVGPSEELYQRPQTEFVATFLGTANLLVGAATATGVQVGALHFPLSTEVAAVQDSQRVQVLFRPEDMALATRADELGSPALGLAEVVDTTFVGSFERLRLHLASLPNVRVIAPAPPFGKDVLVIDALRSHDQARRLPLTVGQQVWVGVRRMHALTHPGLRFLLIRTATPAGQAAEVFGGQLARLAHARTTILTAGMDAAAAQRLFQTAKETIGSGLPALELRAATEGLERAVAQESERQAYDLAVLGLADDGLATANQVLAAGDQHLLLVRGTPATPTRALVCVAGGEPGKEDVLFAARLLRHLGAAATVMTIVPADADDATRERAAQFIAAGARTMQLLGVAAETQVRAGAIRELIQGELAAGGYDLLVLGAPLPTRSGRPEFAGVVAELISGTPHPVLIVRSDYARRGPTGRAAIYEGMLR